MRSDMSSVLGMVESFVSHGWGVVLQHRVERPLGWKEQEWTGWRQNGSGKTGAGGAVKEGNEPAAQSDRRAAKVGRSDSAKATLNR